MIKFLEIVFNKDIQDCIPNSITHLTLGFHFNQKIKNCIPKSVKQLTFGLYFFQNLENCLLYSITHLTLGEYYDEKLTKFPSSLEYLHASEDFIDQPNIFLREKY